MSTCPFCRIAADATASSTVLRSELAVAFLDLRPIRPGHVLVVPRRHEPDFLRLTEPEHAEILALARQLGEAQNRLFKPRKVGLLVTGFDVAHAHLHVVPLHEMYDLTSDSVLKGTLQAASAEELAAAKNAYTRYFLPQG